MIHQVQEKRRRIDQAVDPIKHAAVAGNRGPHVLDPDVPLDHTNRQVAQLPTDADDQTG